MMRAPRVSVVTPVYNGAPFLAECIESVLAQTFTDFEYIILDNQSTDASFEIAQSYAAKDGRIKVHQAASFVSAVDNANRAVALANPDSVYCKVLHADDWLFPECISRMVECADRNPRVGIVGSYRLLNSGVLPERLGRVAEALSGREVARWNLLNGPWMFGTPSSVLMRYEAIRPRVPLYDPTLVHCLDAELCWWLSESWDFGFVSQILSFTRDHEGTQTAQNARVMRQDAELYHLFLQYGPVFLTEQEFAEANRNWRRYYARRLAAAGNRLREPGFRKLHFDALQPTWRELSRGALGVLVSKSVRGMRYVAKGGRRRMQRVVT